MKNYFKDFIQNLWDIAKIIIGTSGYILKPINALSTVLIGTSLVFSYYLAIYYSTNYTIASIYYLVFEILYIGFLYRVLSKNGIRLWLIKKFKTEEKAFVFYQCLLGFLFINNAVSMGYLSTSTKSELLANIPYALLLAIVGVIFLTGYIVKIWSAKIVGIDIYYCKDMFLGRKVSEFVNCGPYRFLANPMYGIGQLQGYAIAILYGSILGLIAVIINQCLVFSFYYNVEKKFIKATYLNTEYEIKTVLNYESESEY